jgi:DNA-binding beta-propeller fold protein YncE
MIYAISSTPTDERFITITGPYTHSFTTLPFSEIGLTTEDHPTSIAVNPNTNKIYVANSGSDTVSVISQVSLNKPLLLPSS